MKKKDMYLRRNSTKLFQELITRTHGRINPIRFFSVKEICKETNNFSSIKFMFPLISVYEGTIEDKHVAVKIYEAARYNNFVDEVVSLSLIKHRNVVKLLGCCIEVENPILIHELPVNGTLLESTSSCEFPPVKLLWADRLRIVTEVAEALAYMHVAHRVPITHGCVTTGIVLLDELFYAKLSAFQICTVQNRPENLEAECDLRSKIARNTDIRFFGILLVHLITDHRFIGDMEGDFITTDKVLRFLTKDACDKDMPQIEACFDLAVRCQSNIDETPSMKEIVRQLREITKMDAENVAVPKIAVLGAGIFVRTQYIPRLRELVDSVVVSVIWSRSEASAKAAVELARGFFPNVECKWGDDGLDEIARDESIDGVAVVLAGQAQVDISLKMLSAGKHVIQEKPAAGTTDEAETALSCYNSINDLGRPIWAVAENYRFEPAFVESRKLMDNIGDMMNVQVIVEGSMNSSNPYFSSSWRRNFTGGFILDMGVHFVAGLRMVVGCEITTVSAVSHHVDTELPPPDNICALFHLENGCAGVFVMTVSSRSPKIFWRIVGSKGTVQVERGNKDGRHGYSVLFWNADGNCQTTFYPFSGVTEELKAFFSDISQARQKGASHEAEPRSSFIEGARDVAVLEAMLESSTKHGAQVHVKRF